MLNIKDLIVPSTIKTETSDRTIIKTTDMVYLQSEDESDEFTSQATDYAELCGAGVSLWGSDSWLRSLNDDEVCIKIIDGSFFYSDCDVCCNVFRPSLRIDISKLSDIEIDKHHKIVKFGEFPQKYVGDKLNKELEKLYINEEIIPTGKTFTGFLLKSKEEFVQNKEYIYNGQKYVRVLSNANSISSNFSSNKNTKMGKYCWCKVSPIEWDIQNFASLPQSINPIGNGRDNFIEITTHEAIMSGIPFYPNQIDKNSKIWQNSTIRGYLNGINVNNITQNGNPDYSAPNGGDFSGKNNFLSEAFDITNININVKLQNKQKTKAEKEIDEIFKKALNKVNNVKDDEMER